MTDDSDGIMSMKVCKMGIYKFVNELVTEMCSFEDLPRVITYHSIEVSKVKGMCYHAVNVEFLNRNGTKLGGMICGITKVGRTHFMNVKLDNRGMYATFSAKSFVRVFHKSLKIHTNCSKWMK